MTDRELFIAALEHADPAERDAWLAQACAGDAECRRRVDVLLRAHDQASKFLAAPAAEQFQPNADDPTRTAHSADETTPAAAIDLQAILTPAEKPGLLGKLDHYEIQEVVGTGGMGVVLKAFDPKLHRLVAIKLMAPHLAAHGSARKRFEREARAVAAVKNEHVVAIHQVETEGRIPYLVMEFIGGVSLQDRLERHGPLDVKEILRIGIQTARGLGAAHAQGIIHRDIKPANVLLENGVERVKITDFGLARAVDDANLTRSGTITGTPNYMSPEQSAGVPVDARSDLFTLGSVLYALCTGHPPFRAETPLAVLRRVADDTPRPVREVNPDIPDWLDAIVRKLLAKSPADRFQTATEVAELLGQHLAHLQQPEAVPMPARVFGPAAPPASTRGWPGVMITLVGFVGLVTLAAFADTFWHGYFRPGYTAPVYMVSVSLVLTLLMAWARRRSHPGWERRWFSFAIATVVFGTVAGLLASWTEDPHLDKLSLATNWHTVGLIVGCALVTLPNLIKAVRCLAANRRAELEIRREPTGPLLDGRTAFAVGSGCFVVVVGFIAASLVGSFEPNSAKYNDLIKVAVAAAGFALLAFGPGVLVARRWWRKRQPSDRRMDSRAAIFAGLGFGLTIASIALVIGRMPAWRVLVFGDPTPRGELKILWDTFNADQIELERDDVLVGVLTKNYTTDLSRLPAGPYTVRAFWGGREVYREKFDLRANQSLQIPILLRMSEDTIGYGNMDHFRVECSDPTVVATLTSRTRTVTVNQPGRSSVVSHFIHPGEVCEFTIVRGQQVLHTETVRMRPGTRRNIVIPWVLLPDRTLELKPKAGEFPADATRMEIAPDRSAVAVGRPGGSILVFDAVTGEERFLIERPKSDCTAFAFTPTGRHLAYVGRSDDRSEYMVRFFDTQTLELSSEQYKPKLGRLANVRAMAFSPDGKRLAVSDIESFGPNNRSRSRIHRWQLAGAESTPRSLDPLEWQEGAIEAMRFTVYGAEVLAVSRKPATAIVWKWDTAQPAALLEEKAPLALLAAGQRKNLVAELDVSPQIWSWRSGQDRWHAPSNSFGPIRSASLALAPDDELVAIGTQGGGNGTWEQRTAVWIWKESRARAVFLGHTDSILDLSFTPDGKSLVAASKDGTLRFWSWK